MDIEPHPGGLTTDNQHNNNNNNPGNNIVPTSRAIIAYLVGKDGANAYYLHYSSSEFFFARCADTIPFETGKLYCLSWGANGVDVISELPEKASRAYLNRREFAFTGSQYEDTVLRSLLLGCRILDNERRRATVISCSPLIVSVPEAHEADVTARFCTEAGDVFDVWIDDVIVDSYDCSSHLHCTPLAGLPPRGFPKNSSLDMLSSNRRIPITTLLLEDFLERKRTISNRRILDRIYGDYASFSHPPVVDGSIISVRTKDGHQLDLGGEQSEAVWRHVQGCPAFAVEGGPGAGKTLLAAAMAVAYCHDGLQLLLSPHSALQMAHAINALETGSKKIIHYEDMDVEERSPLSIFFDEDKENNANLAEFESLRWELEDAPPGERRELRERMRAAHAAALAASGKLDIVLANVYAILEKLRDENPCQLQQQLRSRVKTITIDDAQALSEADLNAIVLSFPEASITLIGDPNQLPAARYRRGDVGSELAGITALEVFKRKSNVPVINMPIVERAPPAQIRHYSEAFYDGQLTSRREESSGSLLSSICEGVRNNQIFVNVWASKAIKCGSSWINDEEMAALEDIVSRLRLDGHDHRSVLVIAYYQKQKELALTRLPIDYEVLTVEEAMGREADIVIILTTRNAPTTDPFFTCHKRCNVALSRHREALVVIGSEGLLATHPWMLLLNEDHFTPVHYVRK